MGSKMEPRWIGSYTVTETPGKGHLKLQNHTSGNMLKNTYHASNLKIYSGHSAAENEKDQVNDVEEVLPPAKQQRLSDSFNPVAPLARRNLATAMELQ